ncbi:MAG: PBP1A family penicillin-binding protein [Deltaproteobacteria bacterium]|nr:PBP1A family penicillin-binding protein [Deltaproteobacteria bacterium]
MPRRLQKEDLRKRFHPVKKQKKKKRRFVRYFFWMLIVLALISLAAFIRIQQLEKIVETKFNVAQKWNIPSRVYADSEYLYPGVDITKRNLNGKLERLGYREVSQTLKGPGDFVTAKDHIDIYLHDFAYPLEKFAGYPVRLELLQGAIQRMVDLESNEDLPLVRLEPEEIATLFDEKMEDRTLITLKECPQYLLEAIITIEDERFFKHHGIDPVGIIRAAAADLLSFKLAQGGSTLTQQLVKNFFLTAKKSIRRKIDEALMALILEKKHTKAEILEAYLNEIYLGQRGPSSVTGVAEAAKHYFAKDIHQLTLSESAMLAGMIRNPSEYSPLRNKERAQDRRNLILKKMREADIITEEAYKKAIVEEIVTPKPKVRPIVAPYFIDFLKNQIADLYPQDILQKEGLKIFTTLDMTMQLAGDEALTQGLSDLEKKNAALLPKDHEGGLQGCVVVVSPQNGYVRAMVGGKNYNTSQFNRCTQAMRQPGSTFKPFVYLTALDPDRSLKKFTNITLIPDRNFTIDTVQGPWSPENYDHQQHGDVTLRTALENSYNIATAKLALDVGLDKVVQTARDAGITSPLDPVPSLALGSFEVSPLEMAMAYTIFPNLGVKPDPSAVINIMTTQGDVLEKKTLKMKRVFNEAPVALVDSLMKGVFERGTAASARNLGFTGIAAGKTGTTSNYRDAWFVGFTPQVLGLVWIGFDDNTPIQMSGAKAGLPIWVAFMKKVVGNSLQDFTFPKEIVQVKTGPQCPKPFTEYFIKGTEETVPCVH